MKKSKMVWAEERSAYLFLAPSIAGVIAFVLFPVVFSLVLSFCDWSLLTPPAFVGLRNYIKLLFRDRLFWKVIRNTVYYTIGSIPLRILVSLGLALLLNQKLRGVIVYRTIYFAPVTCPWVAVAIVWRYLYNTEFGLINYLLGFLGLGEINWLGDPKWAMPAIIFAGIWKDLGFDMVIFLAGLQSIPSVYYEAAKVDGASSIQRFWRITLPLLTPTLFFILTMSIINSFQVFTQAYIMTGGGPMDSTKVFVFYIYENAFRWFRMGYAASMAWILFAIIFGLTLLNWRLQNRWVFYY